MHTLILRPRALFYRTDCTRRSKFLTHALACQTILTYNYKKRLKSLQLEINGLKLILGLIIGLFQRYANHRKSCQLLGIKPWLLSFAPLATVSTGWKWPKPSWKGPWWKLVADFLHQLLFRKNPLHLWLYLPLNPMLYWLYLPLYPMLYLHCLLDQR